MRSVIRGVGVLVVVTAGAAAAFAQGLPAGTEFQVNSTTQSSQEQPELAVLPSGEFLVVWSSHDPQGPDIHGPNIRSRRFAADDTPSGADLQLNSYTWFDQANPSVALDRDGGFVVVYESGLTRIAGRAVASDGQPGGDEYFVAEDPGDWSMYTPDVATDAGGAQVVVWVSHDGVAVRRYDAEGEPEGASFLVDASGATQWAPDVATDGDGGFVVVWTSLDSSPETFEIRGRRFAADGEPLADSFQVNAYSAGHQAIPAVAVADSGEFVVAWSSNGSFGSDTSSQSVQVRRFDADGTALGPDFQVNSYTTSYQIFPDVALDPAGGFVVVWTSNGSFGSDRSGTSIVARRLGAEGLPFSGEFQINSYTTNMQSEPRLEIDADSLLRVVWSSIGSTGGDVEGRSIQSRRFFPPLFADGFELGDPSRWLVCPGEPTCEP